MNNTENDPAVGCALERRVRDETLHLHLRFEYFDAVAQGCKPKEYRDAEKWQKRLDAKKYAWIRLYRGFQKVANETIIDLPYRGYELETIIHPHFGNVAKLVCAIHVTLNAKLSAGKRREEKPWMKL